MASQRKIIHTDIGLLFRRREMRDNPALAKKHHWLLAVAETAAE
jgi:hypothetical protein